MTEAFAIIGVAAVILALLFSYPCAECWLDHYLTARRKAKRQIGKLIK